MWMALILAACATPPTAMAPQAPPPEERPEAEDSPRTATPSAPTFVGRFDAEQQTAFVQAARSHLGTPYRWNGRGTSRLPGLDCLGILFRADEAVTGTPWREFAVNPSELVAGGLLGAAVPTLSGVLRDDVPHSHLQPGDVLYFLLAGYEIPDEPLMVRGDVRYWPWHTGLYAGEGQVIHASPGAGKVVEEPLEHVGFDALYVTR
jgi:cell wall-associated NlpC family hydrolase